MPTSEEFLQRVVEERGLATRQRIAAMVENLAGDQNLHIATLLVQDGLVQEKELVTLLESYAKEEEATGNRPVAENSRFGHRLAEKGLAPPSAIWTALKEQEKARAEGEEYSLDWFLSQSGTLDLSRSREVLLEMDRVVLACRDCGRREILSRADAAKKPACSECQGVMVEAEKARLPEAGKRPSDELQPGREIGGCVIEKLLGKGGMGAVYRARHLALNKTVALKVLSGRLGDTKAKRRFLREARTAAKLEHENIVQVYDTGAQDDTHYIVMQFIEGESVAARIRRDGPLPVKEAVRLAIQSARGVGAAHKLGMIHRDLKPDNIMVNSDGVVKVADFGLAKELGKDNSLTLTHQVMGTPHYMSPEQARDSATVTPSADIYSLGATFYTFLSGAPPFSGASSWEVVSSAMSKPAPDVRAGRKDVPDALAELILQMMEKTPDKRPADIPAVLDRLLAIQRTLDLGPPPVPATAAEPLATLDDFRTPEPGQMRAVSRPSPSPAAPAPLKLDEIPTPATMIPARRGSPWAIPAVVAALVAGAVAFSVFVLPGLIRGPEGERRPAAGGPSGPEAGPNGAAAALERAAGEALVKARAEADSFAAQERYPEAIAVLAAFPERFRKTRAWDQVQEERTRIFNLALGRFRGRIEEMEKRFSENRDADSRQMAAEIAKAIEDLRARWGAAPPKELSGLEDQFEKKRGEIDALRVDEDWLAGIEARIPVLSGKEEAETQERLERLSRSGIERVAGKASDLGGRLADLRKQRMRASEEEGFRQTEAKVRSALEESDAEGASGMLRSFRGSESEAVKKGLAEADSAIRALREDLAALAAARAGDDGARRSFSGIDRARSALQGPGSSRFRRVREEAGRETAALANAEAALARKWAEDGFAVVGPYKGQVGSGEPSDSNPARAVELGRFAIGLREVTGEQYARFVAATGRAAPVGWKGGRPEQGRGLHPVTGVSAEDAEAYCEWLGKEKGGLAVRLPREDEWEIAAGAEFLREGEAPAGKVVDPLREGEAPAEPSIFLPVKLHPYPWGDAFDPVAANLSSGETCEAGAFGKDCSPSGCFDMAGNVCEWTTASPSLWEPSPDGEAAQGKYAVRGGCFADGGSSRSARVAFRQAVPRDTKLSRLGFRVAADVP